MEIMHQEVLSTTNKRLAIILLAFGGKLCQEVPLGWNDVYESCDAFIENAGDPDRSKPRTVISFNFEATKFLKDITKAYQAKNAKAEFVALFENLLADHNKRNVLFGIEVYKEALAAGEFLLSVILEMPETAKWDVIPGDGAGEMIKLGKNSSDELRAEYLNKL